MHLIAKAAFEIVFDVGKAVIFGHGHFRSFSKMIRSFGAIVYINYLYNTIGEICAPENENDRK